MHTAEEPVGHSPAPLDRPRTTATTPETDRGTTPGVPGHAGSCARYPHEHRAVARAFATR
ncbi:hypothetical protein ACIPC1_10450 [Streptomyces sp. NPDC087263]|uniref:hypothetical protein n=1 Tax=Streptomyces sp. NPDC087263 TaxID=3365773 RepID=UPI0037FF9F82